MTKPFLRQLAGPVRPHDGEPVQDVERLRSAGSAYGSWPLLRGKTFRSVAERVYAIRMARVNVYLPDELAEEARTAGLNVSNLTQEALRRALAARRIDDWLDEIAALHPTGTTHDAVAVALAQAKDELDAHG